MNVFLIQIVLNLILIFINLFIRIKHLLMNKRLFFFLRCLVIVIFIVGLISSLLSITYFMLFFDGLWLDRYHGLVMHAQVLQFYLVVIVNY